MSEIVGWEYLCPFVLLSEAGSCFVGTMLIFVGTAVDKGRTDRASVLAGWESFCSYVLLSNPTSLLSNPICTSVNSHFSCVKTKLRDA